MDTIALFGAAGKIGTRISDQLRATDQFRTLYVEAGEAGLARLRDRGLTPTSQDDAIAQADTIVLAIPDTLIGTVAHQIVPQLTPGTLVILLDPAAPHGGELPPRDRYRLCRGPPLPPAHRQRRDRARSPRRFLGHGRRTERRVRPDAGHGG